VRTPGTLPIDVRWPGDRPTEPAAALAAPVGLMGGHGVETIVAEFEDVLDRVRHGATTVVRVPGGLVALIAVGRRHATLLTPLGRRVRVTTATLECAIAESGAAATMPTIDRLLDATGVSDRARPAARLALCRAVLTGQRIEAGWTVQASAPMSWWQTARSARLGWWATAMLVGLFGSYALLLAAFAIVGQAATIGTLTRRTVATTVAVMLAAVPLRLLAGYATGRITITAGNALKQRLHAGVLAVEPDDMRHHGAGHFLSIVTEAEAVETLAASGAQNSVVALVELVAAVVALANGARALVSITLLTGWLAACVTVSLIVASRRLEWTHARGELTAKLTEHIVGHRTRLIQGGPTLTDTTNDDAGIDTYDRLARRMDRLTGRLHAGAARGWTLAAFLVVLVWSPSGLSAGRVAVAVGGILLAAHALELLVTASTGMTDATVAWRTIRPLLHPPGVDSLSSATPEHSEIRCSDVTFATNGRTLIGAVDLAIVNGDRVLIGGASGAGKSTLGELLAGVRQPTTGTIAGTERVGLVPQFHANHLVSGPLAFNLLLGRAWPPTDADLDAAWQVCEELGLGPLLERMPSGLETPVGECGWQLSHGERSRVFVARTLLQATGTIVLDESFAALDPEALRVTLATVLRRTPTVIAIAHA
jgi:ATP-binding cassette, subfamily B, bacterial